MCQDEVMNPSSDSLVCAPELVLHAYVRDRSSDWFTFVSGVQRLYVQTVSVCWDLNNKKFDLYVIYSINYALEWGGV